MSAITTNLRKVTFPFTQYDLERLKQHILEAWSLYFTRLHTQIKPFPSHLEPHLDQSNSDDEYQKPCVQPQHRYANLFSLYEACNQSHIAASNMDEGLRHRIDKSRELMQWEIVDLEDIFTLTPSSFSNVDYTGHFDLRKGTRRWNTTFKPMSWEQITYYSERPKEE